MTYGKVFAALADDTRRGIFEQLRSGPQTVGQLAELHPVSRPAVSQHLKVLQDSGLVDVKPIGTRRIYSVNRDGLQALKHYLDHFWADALSAYANSFDPGFDSEFDPGFNPENGDDNA